MEALPSSCEAQKGDNLPAYPRLADMDARYIVNLPVPGGTTTVSYDEVFECARQNTLKAWTQLAEALRKNKPHLFTLPNADLDTGRDENGNLVFWANNADERRCRRMDEEGLRAPVARSALAAVR